MPALPTITVSDVQQARILDAYKARFETTTTAETVAAFKRWLTGEVRAVVMANEAQAIDEANNAAKRSALANIQLTLPDPDTIT